MGAGAGWVLSVVGLDLYTRGRGGAGLARARTAANPFDHGTTANCLDFWTRGAELAIDYTQLYDVRRLEPGHWSARWWPRGDYTPLPTHN
jgi:palmitoyltransferase